MSLTAPVRLRVLPKLIPLDGKSVEMQATDTALQWRLVGSDTWTDVVPLSDITGPQGPKGDTGQDGTMASVVAGLNVSIDSTDPANPIISAAGDVASTATDASTFGFVVGKDATPADTSKVLPTVERVDTETVYKAADRIAMKALSGAVHSSVSFDGSLWSWRNSDLSTFVTADTVEGVYVAPSSDATGAGGAWVRQRSSLDLDILWFGAVADNNGTAGNGTDNLAAFTAALSLAKLTTSVITVGAGYYRVSGTISIDDSTDTSVISLRRRIKGAGARQTVLVFDTGDYTGIDYTGTNANDPKTIMPFGPVEDILLYKTDGLGIGLKVSNASHLALTNVYTTQWEYGFSGIDIQESAFYNCVWAYNIYGFNATRSTLTQPNSLNFYNCMFGGNQKWGGTIVGAAAVNFFGGSIESNGWRDFTDANRWGFRFYWAAGETAVEGSNCFNLYGTYIERNGGIGDLYYVGYTGPMTIGLVGVNFNRAPTVDVNTSETEYGTNCLLIDNNNAANTRTGVFIGGGTSFKGLPTSTYTPSASRPVIDAFDKSRVILTVGSDVQFANLLERPDFGAWGLADAPEFRNSAKIRVASDATFVGTGVNIATVTKDATGTYSATFIKDLADANYTVSPCVFGGVSLFPTITATSTSGFTIQFYNASAVLTDCQWGAVVTGSGPI